MCKKLVVLCMLLSLVSYAYAYAPNEVVYHPDYEDVTISTWEDSGSADGWAVYTSNGGVGTITPGVYSYGATQDSLYSLKVQSPASWWNEVMYIDLGVIDGKDAFLGNNTFSVDVSWLASEWVDAGTGWNAVPTIGLLVNPGTKTCGFENWWDGGGQTVPVGYWASAPEEPYAWTYYPNPDGTVTLSWNYQNMSAGRINSASTEYKLILKVVFSQFVEPGTFYLDNARLSGDGYIEYTPEPTTIALLGLGSLALLRRKK